MIVDPFDPKQGITDKGFPAAAVYWLPAGTEPTGDLSDATFIGLTEFTFGANGEPDQVGSDTRRH